MKKIIITRIFKYVLMLEVLRAVLPNDPADPLNAQFQTNAESLQKWVTALNNETELPEQGFSMADEKAIYNHVHSKAYAATSALWKLGNRAGETSSDTKLMAKYREAHKYCETVAVFLDALRFDTVPPAEVVTNGPVITAPTGLKVIDSPVVFQK